ncbi:HQD2 Catechol 1 [Candida maltosa Xu316]
MSQAFTESVKNSFGPNATPKAKRMVSSLIQHIHDFARENQLTTEEWLWGVNFINRIGQMSDERRNEGLESLVDALTNEMEHSNHTSSAILGPFYLPGSPVYANGESIVQKALPTDVKAFTRGRVTDTEGNPLAGAKIEVWQCNSAGFYSQQKEHDGPEFNLRGTFIADKDGYYSFECLRPTSYPIPYDGPAGDLLKIMDRHPDRPSHIHWRVSHPGFHTLVTQIYDSECPFTKNDSVHAVKDDIIVKFNKALPEEKVGDAKFTLDYNISLATEESIQQARAAARKEQGL